MPVAEPETVRVVDAHERLIFPLDVPTIEEAKNWIARLEGVVSFFKIGLELYTATGLTLVPYLVDLGKKVFLDLKYFDVPDTVKGAVKQVADLGVSFLTIHGNGRIIEAAVQGRGNSPLKLLSVTVLTSLDNDDMKDLGFECTVHQLVMLRARKALEAGCDGVITSPEEANEVRGLADLMKGRGQFLIVTPGIRTEGDARDDHKRLARPTDAIKAGADYLVIGRPIRDAADPRAKAEATIEEMQRAFDSL